MDQFVNKMFSYEVLLLEALKRIQPGAMPSQLFAAKNDRKQLIQLEQIILDIKGEDGWFPSGGRNVVGQYFYVFSKLKEDEDEPDNSGKKQTDKP